MGGEGTNRVFQYLLALVLPPAGLVVGMLTMEVDRPHGLRVLFTAVLGGLVWTAVILWLS